MHTSKSTEHDDKRTRAELRDHALLTRRHLLGLVAGTAAGLLSARAMAQSATTPRMHTRAIPSAGEALPVVGCGTWLTFDFGPDQNPQLTQTVQTLFDAGGSVLDSSPMYGEAEGRIGDVLAGMNGRAKAFIATKVWTEGRTAGIEQMEQSMRLMRTKTVDLMQVHNLRDWRTQLATLRAWKADGRIRYVGVTHYTSSAFPELEAVMRAEPLDFVQINYAANDRDAEQSLLPLAAERGIAIVVNQPFGGGGLLRSLLGKPLPGWAAEIGCVTWAQVLLKFCLAHPAVTCVIPGTGRPDYMRDNVQAGFGEYPDAKLRARIIAAVEA
jgi:diketogulonate reductase-like aldo/keto reductase